MPDTDDTTTQDLLAQRALLWARRIEPTAPPIGVVNDQLDALDAQISALQQTQEQS
jgi:hypothetical protein